MYAEHHYRKPLEFSWDLLERAERALNRLYLALFTAELSARKAPAGSVREEVSELVESIKSEFLSALADDLNTPRALAALHKLADYILKNASTLTRDELVCLARLMRELGWILGILQQSLDERVAEMRKRGRPLTFLPAGYVPETAEREKLLKLIELIVNVRSELRKRKIFDLADRIRDELRKLGIVLEDTRAGTIWKLVE